MDAEKLFQTASDIAISEEKTNDIFLTITMRMFSTRANRNGEGVTEAFIDEIVGNQEKYECQPLYVDIRKLCNRNYASMGHMYNRFTGKFESTQIGGFSSFIKVVDEYGVSLYGEARIPKREEQVCECVTELYNMGVLSFSFEIRYCPEDTVTIDGVNYVDVSEQNSLTGMAIVSVPAYQESVAFSLVAEVDADNVVVDNEGVETTMTLEEAMQSLAEKDALIAEKDQALAEKDSVIAEKDAKIAEQAETISKMEAEKEDEALKVKEEKDEEKDNMFEELASANQTIMELNNKIAEYEAVKAELDAIKAEKEAAALLEKQNKAKAFAEKQNLDVTDEAVAKAIAELDYETLANLSMSVENTKPEEIAVASYAMTPDITVKNRFENILGSR